MCLCGSFSIISYKVYFFYIFQTTISTGSLLPGSVFKERRGAFCRLGREGKVGWGQDGYVVDIT